MSIIDLNERSNQPMQSRNKDLLLFLMVKYVVPRIKREITKNIKFKTDSDTEVILEIITEFGLEDDGIKQLDGMFSIAVWDKKLKNLFLIRDRIGIKPLFFYFDSKNLHLPLKLKH